ncbi:hypothetical protein DFH07DRAFT_441765 [Mycena maculata]|uniref:DUF6534 domain-containing protein n=1 Tax=Mycena maculata TaxID=230809 RepID=A0AAD7JA30_9AGAR|nr:hypothetical protein DFH07DRAFT_441765 [Mycena maculata]
MSAPIDVPSTMGALLLGGFFASMLSGIVILQALWYFTTYKSDSLNFKALVLGVCTLDTLHTAFIWASMWGYLIGDYGESSKIDYIPWSIALTVVLTALVTFFVHCFFAHRILLLSKHNLLMAGPVVILALLRLVSACVSTWEMFHYQSFVLFRLHARWIFTLGLSVSSAVDILITTLFLYLFQSSRPEAGHLNHILNQLMLYTFETGSLTCIGTVVSMICWVSMDNLIFLGLHFVIGKLYANSLLVTLNTRETIRRSTSGSRENGPVLFLEPRSPQTQKTSASGQYFTGAVSKGATEVQINVERTVQYMHDLDNDTLSIDAK